MKKLFFILALSALSACTDTATTTTEATETIPVEQASDARQYACPMHCEGEKTYTEAGKCPVCEMDLKEIALADTDTTQVP
jgi:hypothetical protein